MITAKIANRIRHAQAREGPLGRFDGPTFVSYYLVTLIVRQLSGAWVMWELVYEIREGKLSLRLLRPIHPLASFSASSLASIPMRAAFVLPIAIGLIATSGAAHISRDPVVIGAFVLSVAGAWVLNFAVSSICGTLAL